MTDKRMLEIARVVAINWNICANLFTNFAGWVITLVKSKTTKLSKDKVNQQFEFSFSKHVFLVYGCACRVIISIISKG